MHEDQVPAWASDLLTADLGPARAVVELLSVPVELSPIREALRRFGEVADPALVSGALLAFLTLGPGPRRHDAAYRLRVLSDIRRLADCPREWDAAIVQFEMRVTLAAVGPDAVNPAAEEIDAWLNGVRPSVHFLVTCPDRAAAAALTVALSRARLDTGTGQATFAGLVGAEWLLGLDEEAWTTARRQLAPMPVAATIPYPGVPPGPRLVGDASPAALDVTTAERRLSALL